MRYIGAVAPFEKYELFRQQYNTVQIIFFNRIKKYVCDLPSILYCSSVILYHKFIGILV